MAGQFFGSGPSVLPGQRRDVAAAGAGRELLRAVLHQADPPRVARTAAARQQPRRAAGRARPLPVGEYGRGAGSGQRCPTRAAGSPEREAGDRRSQRRVANDRSGGRPRPGGNLWRPVQRLSGRGLSPGAADARCRRQAALAADPGEGARPGARTSSTQRRPADRIGPDERRRVFHRRRAGPWEATASRDWWSGCPTAARRSRSPPRRYRSGTTSG